MIQQIDKNGNVVKEWACSVREIAREIGCNQSLIQNVLSGKKPSAKGYRWKKVDFDEVITKVITKVIIPSDEVITQGNQATDEVITPNEEVITETRSLPKARLSVDWFLDPNTDYKDEPQRTIWNVDSPTEKEREYIDFTFKIVSATPKSRRFGSDRAYDNKDEVEGQIASHLEGGYHYKMEPCSTIRRACELLLLDYYLDDKLMEFRDYFTPTN